MKAPELKERLEESEKLIQEMMVSWEEKLRKTEEIAQVLNAPAGVRASEMTSKFEPFNPISLLC